MLFTGEADLFQSVAGRLRIWLGDQFQGKKDVLKGSKCGQEVKELKDKAEPEAAKVCASLLTKKAKVLPLDLYKPFGREIQSCDKVKECAFP